MKKEFKNNCFLAILFALITIFGESYKKINSWNYVWQNITRSILLLCIYFLLYLILVYVLRIIFKKLITHNNPKSIFKIFDKHPFIFPFFIILICWLPFIIIKYPGTPGWDFHHFMNNYYNFDKGLTHHFPLVYVYICVYFIKFGQFINHVNIGLFLLTIFHTLFMLVSFSLTFCYLKKWNINYQFRLFLLLFYSLNPLFLNYSTVIYHDIIYSSLVLIYILIITDILSKNASKKTYIIFSIISLLICLTRKNGIFIVLPTNLMLFFYQNKNYKIIFFLPIIIFFFSNFIFSLKYTKTSILEALSIPIQTVSRYSKEYHDEISRNDKKKISQLIDYDMAAELYNPTIVDDVRNNAGNYEATPTEIFNFFEVWIKLFFYHPTCYIEAVINNTYQLYYPFENTTYIFLSTKDEKDYKTYINFKEPDALKESKNHLEKLTNWFEKINILCFIDDPGYYSWIFIFLLIVIREKKLNVIPMLPLIMTFLCCLAGPTIDYNSRYTFPIIFSCFPIFCYYSKMTNK